ncbi:MAG TPA: HNH endonuclease [Terracidiphilus sp.]|nr:HNH endonuclease [Terracidiphilus sp.]
MLKAGPQRDVRVHTLVAEAMLNRKLTKDEEVHHRNGNKLDCTWTNLQVLGKAEHCAVTARQAWYFRTNDIKAKAAWDKYFDEESVGEKDTSFP